MSVPTMNGCLKIGTMFLGAAYPPLVIAELSGNHNGSLDEALAIVEAAADSGADAIKLQTFTPGTLTIDCDAPHFFIDDQASLWHGRRLWDLYAEAHTPWDWHAPIFDLARSRGLACISTAFDETSVQFLLDLNVDAIKIASFELIHLPLLETVAGTGKPVLLSTGMATLEEIDEAISVLRANRCNQFVLLKCTSAYPASESDANVLTMVDMASRYNCPVGFSDHCLRPYASLAAVALGAAVIEKHVTRSRNSGGVDAAFSLEPHELRELVDSAALVWQSCGHVDYGCQNAEATSLKERPSVYAVAPIKKGDLLTAENVKVIRPGGGLSPKEYKNILGKRANCDLTIGTPFSLDFIASY